VKYEELLGLYGAVAELLSGHGVELTEPEVGEFVTSLDMAGCSLTLVWADDEIEELLSAPAQAPGYVRAGPVPGWDGGTRPLGEPVLATAAAREGEPETDDSGRLARAALAAIAARLHELETDLGDLDAVVGDGDHGTTMTRGIDAAVEAARHAGPDAPAVLDAAGLTFADAAGGASGALWGSGLAALAGALSAAQPDRPAAIRLIAALEAADRAVRRLGGAVPGDKTLVDVLGPFVATYREHAAAGARVVPSWAAAAAAAQEAARKTAGLAARRGRAAKLPDRSVGSEDAGAVSLAASLSAVADVLTAWPADPR
jgi:dihydroxyacetone kinase